MKAEYLQMFLFDIPAFRMRDIDFRFGSDITPLELKENEILLELKPYLQPFEKILALAELKPYLNHDTKIDFFKDEAEEKFLINTKASCRNLLNRLTYWERVGKKTLQPTTQVLYEYTQDCYLKGVNNNKLHRKRRLRYGPHDIHEYRGKFFPQLVRSFINFAGLEPGDVVIDPMVGSGTTLCEANSLGIDAIGCDINPLSLLISKVKTNILKIKPRQLKIFTNKLLKILTNPVNINPEERWKHREYKYLKLWFDPIALKDINIILSHIEECKNIAIQNFFKVCLSNIIRKISWQKDTDLRVRKQIVPYEKNKAFSEFEIQLRYQLNKLIPYLEIRNNYSSNSELYEVDSTKINQFLTNYCEKCDLLISSPPYATALPYLDTDRLSLYILGLLPKSEFRKREFNMIGNREITKNQKKQLWELYLNRKTELPNDVSNLIDSLANINHQEGVGFRRKNLPTLLAKYFLDMKDAMESSLSMMKSDSYGFYIVGNNSTFADGKKVEIPTDKFLFKIGESVGWKQEHFVNMELLPSRDIFKNNRSSSESILVFKAKRKR